MSNNEPPEVFTDDPVALHQITSTRISDLQTQRWVRTMYMLGILVALNFTIAVKAQLDGSNRNALIRQGISCLLADLDDHRHTNQFAHETLAMKHGFGAIQQPDVIPLTKDQAAKLKLQCDHFVHETIGIAGQHSGTEAEGE